MKGWKLMATIWYSINDANHPQCDKPMVFTRVTGNDAGLVAADVAGELAFVTGINAHRIKVWVE